MLLEGKDSPPWTKNERSHSTSKRMWWMTPMYALLLRDRRNPSSCKEQTQIIIWSEQIQLDWTGSDQILMAHRWSFFQSCQMLAHRPLTSNSMTFKWNKTKSSQYTHTNVWFWFRNNVSRTCRQAENPACCWHTAPSDVWEPAVEQGSRGRHHQWRDEGCGFRATLWCLRVPSHHLYTVAINMQKLTRFKKRKKKIKGHNLKLCFSLWKKKEKTQKRNTGVFSNPLISLTFSQKHHKSTFYFNFST